MRDRLFLFAMAAGCGLAAYTNLLRHPEAWGVLGWGLCAGALAASAILGLPDEPEPPHDDRDDKPPFAGA
jgi:hypothetical protein